MITFIGGGNMAEGIIAGMISQCEFSPEEIYVFDVIEDRMRYLEEQYGVRGCWSYEDILKETDYIIMAVHPQDVYEAGKKIRPFLKKGCMITSICAGIKFHVFEEIFGKEQKVILAMPNTLTTTRHGFSAFCPKESVTEEEARPMRKMFECIGKVMEIEEDGFDLFTAYSNTGPTYLLTLITALINAGVRSGYSRQQAREICIENMIGTGMKLEQTGLHPQVILGQMSSPAGVGIEAIANMEKNGLPSAVFEAVETALNKTRGLS